jgi:hypothetical protein
MVLPPLQVCLKRVAILAEGFSRPVVSSLPQPMPKEKFRLSLNIGLIGLCDKISSA